MGYVKQMDIERRNAEQELTYALANADTAIERLLNIDLLSKADRAMYASWQAAILPMLGVLEAKDEADPAAPADTTDITTPIAETVADDIPF